MAETLTPAQRKVPATDRDRVERIADLAAHISALEAQWNRAPANTSGALSWWIAERLLARIDREALAAVNGATERVLGVRP